VSFNYFEDCLCQILIHWKGKTFILVCAKFSMYHFLPELPAFFYRMWQKYFGIFFFDLHVHVCLYKGHSINKLQNSIILLIFKIWQIWNMGFVRNFIGHIYWNFCEDDMIIVTSHVHRIQSVSAVFCPFFYHLPSVKHHCELRVSKNEHIQQWNLFTCQTSTFYFSTYRPNLFKHLHYL